MNLQFCNQKSAWETPMNRIYVPYLWLQHDVYSIWKGFDTEFIDRDRSRTQSPLMYSLTPEKLISKKWHDCCRTLQSMKWTYISMSRDKKGENNLYLSYSLQKNEYQLIARFSMRHQIIYLTIIFSQSGILCFF